LPAPYRPEGVDSHLESIAIFSVNPVAAKISNFTSGQVFTAWSKSYSATVFTMADVKNGVLLVVKTGATEITNLKTGAIMKILPVKITSAEFGELDNYMYYGDDTNNEYRYLSIVPPADERLKFSNCIDYVYGIGRCMRCKGGTFANTLGNCEPINGFNNTSTGKGRGVNGNNIPGVNLNRIDKNGGFLDPKQYTASLGTVSDNRTMIEFGNLENLSPVKRLSYLQNLANKDGSKNFVHYILINDDNVKWRQDRSLKFYP
jgi:hypothetical protein